MARCARTCAGKPESQWHAQLARGALALRVQRSQVPHTRGRFEGPAGLQLGPRESCSPSLRSPQAQVVDPAERQREHQRLLASWAAFLIRAFPGSDFGGRRAQIVAGALMFPGGRNSGGGDDGPRAPPLLPYVLPGDSPAPTVTFLAEVCARPCHSAPARLPRAAVRLQSDRAKRAALSACRMRWEPLATDEGKNDSTVSCRWRSQRAPASAWPARPAEARSSKVHRSE